jgi:hypothetical protein
MPDFASLVEAAPDQGCHEQIPKLLTSQNIALMTSAVDRDVASKIPLFRRETLLSG